MWKLQIEKLTRLTKQVFFLGVSQLLLSMIVRPSNNAKSKSTLLAVNAYQDTNNEMLAPIT